MKNANFLLVGVGGQGTLLVSNVMAHVGVRAGFDVKKAEVHGMAQRGGSVSSHIRWGEKIHSPLIGSGEVDYLLAFEKLEALRYVEMLRPGATVLVGEMCTPPLSVSSGDDVYPSDEEVRASLGQVTDKLYMVPSLSLAQKAGSIRAHNVVMMGALSRLIEQVPLETWLAVVSEWVPKKYIEVNQRAFCAGRDVG
ncbi:MAG: indolepyruvate oxidoreductase subunit beta [Thermoflexales bacterium]|nr:indolepyruvate oxidoreductase subunit beta [Thermoflexales bacterium]